MNQILVWSIYAGKNKAGLVRAADDADRLYLVFHRGDPL